MEIFGHNIAFFGAMLRRGFNKKEALRMLEEHSAKLCLTDAIRFAVKGENVVRAGRGYSHYTDGCAMKLPYGESLKTFTDASKQTTMITGEGYRNKFADKLTDFSAFFTMNPEMFTAENIAWGMCVLAHLQQDVNSDILWQEKVCECDTENDKVIYKATGKVVDGKTFREDMAFVNIFMNSLFVNQVRAELTNEMFSEAEFISSISKSFDRHYTEDMANNTKKYLIMDNRVFHSTDEEYETLVDEIIFTGMFANERHLWDTSVKLFENSITSTEFLMNHFVI